jgi:hypothetical protein
MNNEAATTATVHTMTEQEATDQAVLLLVRKMMRLHPVAYADMIKRLPVGARDALAMSEIRADILRDRKGFSNLKYPTVEEPSEEE